MRKLPRVILSRLLSLNGLLPSLEDRLFTAATTEGTTNAPGATISPSSPNRPTRDRPAEGTKQLEDFFHRSHFL